MLDFLLLPLLFTASNSLPAVCLTTLPQSPAFIPPAPYPTDASGGFWYGSDVLWTRLPLSGDWARAGLGYKFFFFSKNFDWRTARQLLLMVTGNGLTATPLPLR